ncbi:Ydc2-catalyt-domain-containing protein, partial [Nadsonia fulvescens var. elongata DSM 6958]
MEDYLNKDISANQLELDTLESPIGMTKIAYDFAQSYIFDNYKFGTKLTSSKSKKLIKGRKNIEILKARIPDIVLIERQRDRSMPNTATPGWTAKVNRLEGMIYSTIYTISQQHNLDILLEPILPAKVAKYWIRGLDEECTTNLCTEDAKNIRAKLTKTTKTQRTILAADLFDQCIDQNPSAQFVLSDRADDQALLSQIFFNANKAKRADRRKTALNTKLNNKDSKEDDLADSMLQALTWLRWQ